MRIRRRALLLAGALACELLTSACSGPRNPISVTVQEVSGDVAIGAKPVVIPLLAPTHVNPVPIGFPSFIQPPPPIVVTDGPAASPRSVPTPPRVSCGSASANAVARVLAPNNVNLPPANQVLTYHDKGTYSVTPQNGKTLKGDYPLTSTRQIQSVKVGDGSFAFNVDEFNGGIKTSTLYHLIPNDGIYLSQIVDGTGNSFTAQGDTLKLLPLPVTAGAQVGGSALDSRSVTTLTFVGKVVGHTRVDACGTLLDAIKIDITDGRITSPSEQLHFTASYSIGTQYGGLSIADHVTYDCPTQITYCDAGRAISLDNTASVTSEPHPGKSP